MSDLDRVRISVRFIEACLESSDWDALSALDTSPPSIASGVDDVESLTEVLREVQKLQHRVEVAMGAIREELDDVPQMRKAARAYTSVV